MGRNRQLPSFALFLLVGLVTPGALAETTTPEPPTQLSFVCATTAVPAVLKPLVAELVAKHRDSGVAVWGDRAAVVRVGRTPSDRYFVPLSCGATGNCT